jgi:predicted amidohydrolase
MERFIAAAIQMSSTSSKSDNLSQAAKLIDEAAARGAQLVCLPETMNYIGPTPFCIPNHPRRQNRVAAVGPCRAP